MSLDAVVRVGVVVTFLRMERVPAEVAPVLPDGCEVRVMLGCSVELYRFLYDTVGADYLWWLRRTMPDGQLAALLQDPKVSIHVLYRDGVIAGFYELDRNQRPVTNLSYFGLMPTSVGANMGFAFLRHAVDTAWREGARAMTVNTCTADHRRALPNYLRAGFRVVREMPEEWQVPVRLGLAIPPAFVLS